MTLELATEILGWACVINFAILIVSSMALVLMRKPIAAIHGPLFGMSEQDLGRAYFQYLGSYKIMIVIFNLTPWIALKLVA